MAEKQQIFVTASEKGKISRVFDLAPKDSQRTNITKSEKQKTGCKSLNLSPKSNKSQEDQINLRIDAKPGLKSQKSQQNPTIVKKDEEGPSQGKLNNSFDFSSNQNKKMREILPVINQFKALEKQNENPQEKSTNLIPRKLIFHKLSDEGNGASASNLNIQGANIKANNFMRNSKDGVSSLTESKQLTQDFKDPVRLSISDEQLQGPTSAVHDDDPSVKLKINNLEELPGLVNNNLDISSGFEDNLLIRKVSEDYSAKKEVQMYSTRNLLPSNLVDQSFQNSFDVLNLQERMGDNSVIVENKFESSIINDV